MKKKSFFYLVAAVLLAMMSIGNAKAEVVKDGIHYYAETWIKIGVTYEWIETDYYMVTKNHDNINNYNYLSGDVYLKSKLYGKNVEIIESSAFANMYAYVNIICPKTLKTIEEGAFRNASGLLSVQMNEGLTTLGNWAFQDCKNLTSVYIPTTLNSLPNYAFAGCTSLPDVSIPAAKVINEFAFFGCTNLVAVHGETATPCPAQTIKTSAFQNCSNLQSANFDRVISIGLKAFQNCTKLDVIVLPATLTSIDEYAFSNTGLKVVNNENPSPQTIKANVFEGVNLSKCILYVPEGTKAAYKAADVWNKFGYILEPGEQVPTEVQEDLIEPVKPIYEGVATINGIMYRLNADLTASVMHDNSYKSFSGKITIPSKVNYEDYEYVVTAIDDNAFQYCNKITDVVLPNNLTSLGKGAFRNATALQTIALPSSLQEIGEQCFYECESLGSVSLPNSLKELGTETFFRCFALESVSLPAGIETIGKWCFAHCKVMTSLTLPESLKEIGEAAFYNCRALKDVILPASLEHIGKFALYSCEIDNVIALSETPATAHEEAFSGVSGYHGVVLHVPAGSKSAYAAATGWKAFANIHEAGSNDKVKYGDLYYQLSDDYTAYVTFEKENSTDNYKDLSGEVTVQKKVTYLGADYEVTAIGKEAFKGATGITKVNLPEVLDEIKQYAFYQCTNLAEINIPATLSVLNSTAFSNTKLFNDNTDGDGAVYYDGCLLALTKQLPADYTVKDGTRLIATKAFYVQNALTTLTIPESVQVLCEEALSSLFKLKSVTLPSSLKTIGDYFLFACPALNAIYCYAEIPYNLSKISAFEGTDAKLCTLYVPEGCKDRYANTDKWMQFPVLEMETKQFTVKFVDYDGRTIKTDVVEKGNDAVAPADPTRVGYTFTGWDKAFTNITADLTVTAQYDIKKYTVTFVDWDDAELNKQIIVHGQSAEAPTDPERAGFTFTGWDKEFDIVTADLTVKAQYAAMVWTITYLNWDGELLGTEQVENGQDAKGVVATKVGWYFDTWYNTKTFEDVDLKNITSDLTVKAQFLNEVLFNVIFRVDGVTTYEIQTVYGYDVSGIYYNPPYASKIPERAPSAAYEYVFAGWTPAVTFLTSDVVLEAVFEASPRKYTVSFYDWDGDLLEEQKVEYGKSAEGFTPDRVGYTFTGWDKSLVDITSDLTVKAQYQIKTYTVRFVDWDESELSAPQTIEHGHAAATPATPTREGYTFTGWDGDFTNITADLTLKATYKLNSYTVSWLKEDGSLIDKTVVEYGAMPEHDDAVKAESEDYTYTFTGWIPALAAVSGDANYVATFEAVSKEPETAHTIKYLDKDADELKKEGIVLHLPEAPVVSGFTFVEWRVVEGTIDEGIVVRAAYKADGDATELPDVLALPGNSASKLVRDGVVYILQDEHTYTIQGQKVK